MVLIRAKFRNPSPTTLDFWRQAGYTAGQPHPQDTLRDHLLAIAGMAVCLPGLEEDAGAITQRGELWRGYNALMRRGEPCHCHSNSASLWAANRRMLVLCVGYGMSDDAMWRQHTWCVLKNSNRVVETTVKRVLYYGFRLTPRESLSFCENNCLSAWARRGGRGDHPTWRIARD